MTPDDDREPHEAKADELERGLDEMQERSGRLQGDIDETSEDWERKRKDESVPGAVGGPGEDDEGGDDDGGGDVSADELDFGADEDVDLAPQGSGEEDSDEDDDTSGGDDS